MLRICSISYVTVLAIVLCALPASGSSEPNPWLELHSAHFTVITDAGERRGREVAFRFEQMRAVFGILLGKERINQPVPLTILALKNDKSYYQLAPLRGGQPIDVPGFFLPGEDQEFIALNLSENEPWYAVAHDFAHMLLNYNYPPAQGWFDEGLAEYFSSIRLDNRQVELGGDPELQTTVKEDLIGNQRDTHPQKSLTELLGAEVWISLPDLFTMKHDTLTFNEGTHHTLYYAESWMVMHYLLHEKKLTEIGNYFNLVLNQHIAVQDAIPQAFGMSADQLEKAVKDYFHSQAWLLNAVDTARQKSADPDHPTTATNLEQGYRFPTPIGPDDSVIPSKPLPEADARAIYAEVQIRIPERRETGLKDLQTLANTPTAKDVAAETRYQTRKQREEKKPTEDPDQLPTNSVGNEIAHRVLAYDYIQHGDFDKALSELSDAAALDRQDMWVRYYLSVLKYRMATAKKGEMQGIASMMQDLKAVLEWYPEFASAYDLLAQARKEGGSTPAAMQSERAAMMLSPRDEEYVYHLAQIYIASKKWDAAQALLVRLKESGNPQLAAQAREQLEQATAQNKYGIPINAASQPQFAPQKSPFDVLEEDAAKRAAAEKAAQAAKPANNTPARFFEGRLIAVDCSKTPTAILTVTEGGVVLKLRAVDYKSLLLIGADQFSCDWKDRKVSVNYKPGGLTDGDLVSLEVR